MKLVIATGGFDPVHSGHIAYLEAARQLGDRLIVGLNSDAWLTRKKGRAFMPWEERAAVLKAMSFVGYVLPFDDSDDSAVALLESLKQSYPYATLVFANGGDRTATNIPEMTVKDVIFQFGVGGDNKANSSSWILDEWRAPKIDRPWGYYRVLHEIPGTKVKELTVMPGQRLSMQRHQFRSEHWTVSEGQCVVNSQLSGGYAMPSSVLAEHDTYHVPVHEWHQLTNPFTVPCRIIEIQTGSSCTEEDIERLPS